MKEILMMMQSTCPHCKRADKMIALLTEEKPEYKAQTIRRVDERIESEFADTLDYYYVPTFYVDGEKLHEGAPTLDAIRAVLDKAME